MSPLRRTTAQPSPAPRPLAWCLVALAFLTTSCAAPRPTPNDTAYTITDVPIPPALDDTALTTKSGDDLTRANLTLDQILQQIPRPEYLPPLDTTPEHTPDDQPPPTALENEPPLDAQRSYIRGRVAWLYRDVAGAKRHFRAAHRIIPESTDLMRTLAEIHMHTLEPKRAANLLERTIQGNPDDTHALYLLGRYAGDQRNWNQSITTLARVLTLPRDSADPALHVITHYLLGNALAQQGYDAAAIDQLSRFLELPERFARTTRMVRELLVLSRERNSTWQTVGDAYHRLGHPLDALQAYQHALGHSRVIRETLVWRLVYSHLRLGRVQDAQYVVLDDLDRRGADDDSLRMVRYLVTHGADRHTLAQTLRSHYDSGTDTPPVVLALAELLPNDQAILLLHQHITTHPTDQTVLRQLIRLHNRDNIPTPQTITTVAQVIHKAPYLAPDYAKLLIDLTADPTLFTQAVNETIAASPDDAALRYIAAAAHHTNRDNDLAIEQLRHAVKAQPPLPAARVKLAQLLAEAGRLNEASATLQPLADSRNTNVIRLRARIMAKSGKVPAALALLDDAIFENPNDLDLTLEKASLHLTSGNPEGAERTLLDALDNQPRAEQLYEQLIALYQSGRINEPAQPYQQLVRRMMRMIPLARVARLERAKVLAAGKRYDQAVTILKQLLTEDPNDTTSLALLAQSLSATDRAPEAGELLETALADNPDDRKLLSVALAHYRRVNDRDKIIATTYKMITSMITQRPLQVRTLDGLMKLLTSLDASQDLTPLLDAQLAAHPDDRNLLILAHTHYQRTDDQQRVFQTTENLLSLDTPGPLKQVRLAIFYIENDKLNQALDALQDVLEGDDYATVNAAIGLISQAMAKHDKPQAADRWFKQAVAKHPKHAPQLRFGWAIHRDKRGDREQAERTMADLIDDHPEHAEANNWLGYTWADRGVNLDRAHTYIQRALDTEPDNAAYLDSMGWVLYKLGRFDEALAYLQRAGTSNGGDHPVIVDHLGDTQYRLGHTDQATDTWRRARRTIAEDPDSTADPELRQLAVTLDAKLTAVNDGTPPPIADTSPTSTINKPNQTNQPRNTTPSQANRPNHANPTTNTENTPADTNQETQQENATPPHPETTPMK